MDLLTTAENLEEGGTYLCHFLSLVFLLFLWVKYFLKCWCAVVRLLVSNRWLNMSFFLTTLLLFWSFFNWFSFWSNLRLLFSFWRRQGDDLPAIYSFRFRRWAEWWRFIVLCLRFLLRLPGLCKNIVIWCWFDGFLTGLWWLGSFPSIIVSTEQCPSLTISWPWTESLGISSSFGFLLIDSLKFIFTFPQIQIILFVDLCQIHLIDIFVWFHSIDIVVFENIVNRSIIAFGHSHTVAI